MEYTRIKILKESDFKPRLQPHHSCISPKMKKYLLWVEQIKDKIHYTKRDKYYELRSIAKFFNIKLIIRHELKKAGGTYCFEKNVIEIGEHRYGRKKSLEWLKTVFAHELAHAFQDNIESLDFYWDSLGNALRLEQEAEAVAKQLCKIFFPNDVFKDKYFWAYFKEKDIIFLAKYQKELPNNLFEWRKK